MHMKLLAGIAGFALVAAACGDESNEVSDAGDPVAATAPDTATSPGTTPVPETTVVPDTTTAPETTAPATIHAPESTSPPADELAIVSLSPTLTEMVFAIGAGDDLVAVDEFSTYPPEALDLPHELSGYEPNVEAIAGYEPDVVLISGDFTGLGDQLEPLGIELWDGPAAVTLNDTYDQIGALGELTGHVDEAAALVAQMRSDIDTIIADLPEPAEPLTYYHELDPELYTVTSNTFIGSVYSLVGLENVADAAADETDYPQLNAEYLVESNPDLIFLADTKCCGESLDTVSARPGWDSIAAVQTGSVIEMDDDIASRWGPRIVDYLHAVVDAVADVRAST